MTKAAAILLSLVLATPANACIGRMMPQADQPELYSDIITAKVIAVEVTGGIIPAGFSPRHNLTVKIRDTIKGDMVGEVTLNKIQGCGVPVPKVGQWATFYINGDHVNPGRYRKSAREHSDG